MNIEIIELAKQAGFYQDQPMYYDEQMLGKFFRLAYARGMLKQAEQGRHWSDCAVNSEPAYPTGECDCGGYSPDQELLDSAKAFYNATITDPHVRISSSSQEKRDVAFKASERLRIALQVKLEEKNT